MNIVNIYQKKAAYVLQIIVSTNDNIQIASNDKNQFLKEERLILD